MKCVVAAAKDESVALNPTTFGLKQIACLHKKSPLLIIQLLIHNKVKCCFRMLNLSKSCSFRGKIHREC